MSFSRREILRCSLAVAGALVLSGCDDARANANDLRFWNPFTGPDGPHMLRLVKRFNAEHDGVAASMQRMPAGTYYNKLFVAALGRRAPDVFVVHTDALFRFVQAKLVRPVDDLFGFEMPADDFVEVPLAGATYSGVRYGVPLDTHPLGMFVNRKLFRAAGIIDEQGEAKPPTNAEEFIDAARRLTFSADGRKQWGFVYTWLRTNVFAIFSQFGANLLDEDGSPDALLAPEAVAAAEFCRGLVGELGVAPRTIDLGGFIGFRQGQVGMLFEGIYMLPELLGQTDLDFLPAPVPRLGPTPATWVDSHLLCLRSDLSGARLDAAKAFVRYLSANSLQWAKAGQVPIRKSLQASENFRTDPAFAAQRAFGSQIPHGKYFPTTPFIFELQSEFDLVAERIVNGTMDSRAALTIARDNLRRVKARYDAAGVA